MNKTGKISIIKSSNDLDFDSRFASFSPLGSMEMNDVKGGKILPPICRELCSGCLIRIGCNGRTGLTELTVDGGDELTW